MSDPKKPEAESSPEERPASASSGPYEAPLTKAFDKLTSQIFIFLLAYVILLIGLTVFGSQLADTLRNLFYIIPVLGVIAYVWLQQRGIVKDAKEKGIDVKAGMVSDSARVFGVRGAKAGDDLPENVRVGTVLARGNAEVGAVIYGDAESEVPQSGVLEVLTDIFKQLDRSSQIELISSAQSLLDKQGERHA